MHLYIPNLIIILLFIDLLTISRLSGIKISNISVLSTLGEISHLGHLIFILKMIFAFYIINHQEVFELLISIFAICVL